MYLYILKWLLHRLSLWANILTAHLGKLAVPHPRKNHGVSYAYVFNIDIQYKTVISRSPSTVAAHSKAWTVFARSNSEIVCSSPSQGMDVCLPLLCVCVGSGLATGWSRVQGLLLTVLRLRNWSETKRFTDALCSKWEQQEWEREKKKIPRS
jgi:hypothetical protein